MSAGVNFHNLLAHARRDMLGRAIDLGLQDMKPREAAKLIAINEKWFWVYVQECRFFWETEQGILCFQCGAIVSYGSPKHAIDNGNEDIWALEMGWCHDDIHNRREWKDASLSVYSEEEESISVVPILLHAKPGPMKLPRKMPTEDHDVDVFPSAPGRGYDRQMPLAEFRRGILKLYEAS